MRLKDLLYATQSLSPKRRGPGKPGLPSHLEGGTRCHRTFSDDASPASSRFSCPLLSAKMSGRIDSESKNWASTDLELIHEPAV